MSVETGPTIARRAARLHDDPRAAAIAAGSTYVAPDAPGLTRVRSGRGFAHRDSSGRPADASQRRRFAALAIPPAWTDVWICACADGHLQCTGLAACRAGGLGDVSAGTETPGLSRSCWRRCRAWPSA